jgi:hypothetical protein
MANDENIEDWGPSNPVRNQDALPDIYTTKICENLFIDDTMPDNIESNEVHTGKAENYGLSSTTYNLLGTEQLILNWWNFQKAVIKLFAIVIAGLLGGDIVALVVIYGLSGFGDMDIPNEWPFFTQNILVLILPLFAFVLGMQKGGRS